VVLHRPVEPARVSGNWARPKIPLLGSPLFLLYSHIAAAVAFRQSRTRQQKLLLQTLINGILPNWVTCVAASCGDHTSGRNYEYMGSAVASGARDWRNLLLQEKGIARSIQPAPTPEKSSLGKWFFLPIQVTEKAVFRDLATRTRKT
jgi:hypothetical protein